MKPIAKTLLISLFLICAILIAKYSCTPIMMEKANYGLNRLFVEKSVDNLFIGSSMFRQGIDTSQIFDSNSSFNLCFNGNQPWQEYLQIKELLAHNVSIDTVYIDMYYGTITQEVKVSDQRILQGASYEYTKEIYEEYRKNNAFDLSSFYNFFITANNELFSTFPISFKFINSRYDRGNSTGRTNGSTPEALAEDKIGVPSDNDKISSIQLEYLYNLIELCNANNIGIVFIETPKYIRLYTENGNYKRIMNQYLETISAYDCYVVCNSQTYLSKGNDKILNYEFDISNPSYYQDILHLSSAGRSVFSKTLKHLLCESSCSKQSPKDIIVKSAV